MLLIEISKIGMASPFIDGNIDSVWYYADSIATFVQWNPEEGKSSTESTKVYICCDDKNIYIAFRCFDSEPEKLDVKVVDRDCKFILDSPLN